MCCWDWLFCQYKAPYVFRGRAWIHASSPTCPLTAARGLWVANTLPGTPFPNIITLQLRLKACWEWLSTCWSHCLSEGVQGIDWGQVLLSTLAVLHCMCLQKWKGCQLCPGCSGHSSVTLQLCLCWYSSLVFLCCFSPVHMAMFVSLLKLHFTSWVAVGFLSLYYPS